MKSYIKSYKFTKALLICHEIPEKEIDRILYQAVEKTLKALQALRQTGILMFHSRIQNLLNI